jgi:hypothetical protein
VKDYVGNDSGDLLILHVDCDLKTPFPDRVRNARFLQLDAFYYVVGEGKLDSYFGPSGWELKTTLLTSRPHAIGNKSLPRSEEARER